MLKSQFFRTSSCTRPHLSISYTGGSPTCSENPNRMEKVNTIGTTGFKSKEKQAPSIRFLNLTNPNDATKSDALTVIRSHVAKNTHGRKQESRRARLEIRQYRPSTRTVKSNDRWSQEDGKTRSVQEPEESKLPVARRRQSREGSRLFKPEIWTPNPQTFVTSNRKNPFQTSVKAISDLENALVDHCKYPCWVLLIAATACVTARVLIGGRYNLCCRSRLYRLHTHGD